MKTVFVLLLLCTTAAARIGETFEEFCKHHQPDKPAVQAEYDMTRHVEDGRRVTVFWINGKSAQETRGDFVLTGEASPCGERPGQWPQQAPRRATSSIRTAIFGSGPRMGCLRLTTGR